MLFRSQHTRVHDVFLWSLVSEIVHHVEQLLLVVERQGLSSLMLVQNFVYVTQKVISIPGVITRVRTRYRVWHY